MSSDPVLRGCSPSLNSQRAGSPRKVRCHSGSPPPSSLQCAKLSSHQFFLYLLRTTSSRSRQGRAPMSQGGAWGPESSRSEASGPWWMPWEQDSKPRYDILCHLPFLSPARPIFLGPLTETEQLLTPRQGSSMKDQPGGGVGWLQGKSEAGDSLCSQICSPSCTCDCVHGPEPSRQLPLCTHHPWAVASWLPSSSLSYYPGVIGYWQPITECFTSASSVTLRQLCQCLFQ